MRENDKNTRLDWLKWVPDLKLLIKKGLIEKRARNKNIGLAKSWFFKVINKKCGGKK